MVWDLDYLRGDEEEGNVLGIRDVTMNLINGDPERSSNTDLHEPDEPCSVDSFFRTIFYIAASFRFKWH